MRYFWAALSVTCCLAAAPAMGGDCPASGPEERIAAVAKAGTCQEAVDLCRRCSIGGMLDVSLASSVNDVCEKTALSKLTKEEREAYKAATDACYASHSKKRGTLHRSAPAHCWVDVMADYASHH